MSDAGILTTAVDFYANTFNGYLNQFLQWGEWLFYSCVTITIVWLCLWNAFDRNSFQESMPDFLKEFFVMALFYTIMLNAGQWLYSIVHTATSMGSTLSHHRVDPSSIITQGLAIANKIAKISASTSVLANFFGVLMLWGAFIVVFFSFASVALDLALTIITISFLISLAGLSLAFAAFSFTRAVARKTLDLVIANSMKLLALYAVVSAGSSVFERISSMLPDGKQVTTFDVYSWVVVAALLFWIVSRNLPAQVARIFSDVIQESRGTDAAALAMSAVHYARSAIPAANLAAGGAAGLTKIAGSIGYSTGANFSKAKGAGLSAAGIAGQTIKGVSQDIARSAFGSLTDHFKHLGSKLSGGPGLAAKAKDIPGFAQRMYREANSASLARSSAGVNSNSLETSKASSAAGLAKSSAGAPSSAGRKAAAPSSTRSAANKASHKKK